MPHSPALSVIMPVRNAELTVEAAIRSILASTFQDFEFIIVDDASSDASVEKIKAFQDARIRLLENANPGLCQALNLAVAACSAPFIARMDADDISYPSRFEKQLDAAERNRWDVVGGKVRIVDRTGNPVTSYARYESWINDHQSNESIYANRFVESPIANPTSVARRSVYEQPFLDGPFPEDYEFWLQAMSKGFRFGKINEIVLDWIDAPSRTTRNHSRYSPEAFNDCRRRHLLSGPLANHEWIDFWGVGLTGKPWIRFLQESGKRIRHLIDVSPKKIGQTIHGAKVISPPMLPAPDGTPIVAGVGALNARDEIESFLAGRGYRIGLDAWFVA